MRGKDRDPHDEALELQALDAQDRLRLALAQNAAENGRLFCIMLFAVSIAALFVLRNPALIVLAVLSATPVGLSVIAERLRVGRLRRVIEAAVLAIPALVAVFLVLWGIS